MNRLSSGDTAPRSRPRRRQQRGAVLMIVLVVMIVAVTSFAIWGRAAVRERRQADVRLRAVQANWLVESGVERAIAQLREAEDYAGETWALAASELDSRHPAAVTIRVETPADAPRERTIHVRSDYPPEATHRVRRSKTIQWNLD